jgi:hypothetical protein
MSDKISNKLEEILRRHGLSVSNFIEVIVHHKIGNCAPSSLQTMISGMRNGRPSDSICKIVYETIFLIEKDPDKALSCLKNRFGYFSSGKNRISKIDQSLTDRKENTSRYMRSFLRKVVKAHSS